MDLSKPEKCAGKRLCRKCRVKFTKGERRADKHSVGLLSTHTMERALQVAKSMTDVELSNAQPFVDG